MHAEPAARVGHGALGVFEDGLSLSTRYMSLFAETQGQSTKGSGITLCFQTLSFWSVCSAIKNTHAKVPQIHEDGQDTSLQDSRDPTPFGITMPNAVLGKIRTSSFSLEGEGTRSPSCFHLVDTSPG